MSRVGLVGCESLDTAAAPSQATGATLYALPAAGAGRIGSAEGTPGIGTYGFLSDSRSAALVGLDGSIDWLCWPRFDSPSLFARILDADNGGAFAISPTGAFTVERSYVRRTNVLQTTFRTATGAVRVNDWLDTGAGQALCRLVEGLEGEVELSIVCDPRPRYGLDRQPVWEDIFGYLVCATGDGNHLILNGVTDPCETVTLAAGQVKTISLGWNRPGPSDLSAALRRAIPVWRKWWTAAWSGSARASRTCWASTSTRRPRSCRSRAEAARTMNRSIGLAGHPRDGSSEHTVRDDLNRALASIRQRLRGHAGDVVIAGVDDGVVTLDYQGACRGCPALHFTHAAVVQVALERVEGVTSVTPPRSDISPAVLERIRRMTTTHLPIPDSPPAER